MRPRTCVALFTILTLACSAAPAAHAQTVMRTALPTYDISIKASDPNSAYPENHYYLYVRGDAFRATERTLIAFNLAPLFQDAAAIESAELQLYRAPGIGFSTPEPDPNVRIYRATQNWTVESAEWNSQPAVASAPSAWQGILVPNDGRYISWDVTAHVRAWFAGEPNHGFVLSGRPDRADEQYTEYTVVFESTDSAEDGRVLAGYDSPPRGHSPRLHITYQRATNAPSPVPISLPVVTFSPTPTPTPTPKSIKSTKGAYTERGTTSAPWWMSPALRWLLGYRE
ncbi:MAG: hypothetical protein G01um1014106_96 [Parcubacteria group bacterium Gr01-1014_106]|nr:MAG: hypothetical protein G01um1014106_96 [Parcubacteria group bacterium Gr01-1014_106]